MKTKPFINPRNIAVSKGISIKYMFHENNEQEFYMIVLNGKYLGEICLNPFTKLWKLDSRATQLLGKINETECLQKLQADCSACIRKEFGKQIE